MEKVIAWLAGAALGFVVLGATGFGAGWLYLAWFAGPSCCGLEGLYAPIVGTFGGAGLGVLAGGVAGLVVRAGRRIYLELLLVLLVAGVGVVGIVALVAGPMSVEDTFPVVGTLTLMFFGPVIIWIGAVLLAAQAPPDPPTTP